MPHKRSAIAATAILLSVLIVLAATAFASPQKKEKPSGRLLYGRVLDPQDNPLPDAVVYLTNTRTRSIKSYIVGTDGSYRFPSLSTSIDYEVYAQYKGHKSDTKSVSQFDDRTQVYLDLRVDLK